MGKKLFTKNRILLALMLAVTAAFGFYVNRGIVIKGLYMDDLYMWSCYGEQSIWEFAFPIGTSTRFRPVYWLATYLQMYIIGTHPERFVAFNVIINILVAWELMFMAYNLAGKGMPAGLISGAAGLLYLASRFAYYQIGQALGLMETMALSLSIGILYLLLKYSGSLNATYFYACASPAASLSGGSARPTEESAYAVKPEELPLGAAPGAGGRCYYAALILWFLVVFVHERYMALFPLFYISLGVRLYFSVKGSRKKAFKAMKLKVLLPLAVLLFVIAVRSYATGSAVPAGTGGTAVADTFSLREAVSYAFAEVLYIFGINAGPEYLCGLEWGQTPPNIKLMVKLGVLCTAVICAAFAFCFISAALCKKRRAGALGEGAGKGENGAGYASGLFASALIFASFIGLCIGCSSVTIRLEMRWIYVSYAAALMFAAYMLGAVLYFAAKKGRGMRFLPALSLTCWAAYTALSIYTNIYCRGYFTRLYFWPDQLRMNSLAEETVEKYGTAGVFGKNIYILENTYGMSDFYARTFFKVYDPQKKAEGTAVIFVQNADAVPEEEIASGSCIVLMELPEENAYRDITDGLKGRQDG